MDWEEVTQAWVRDGLLEERQRGPILAWLRANASPAAWIADRVVPAVTAVASLLLCASTATLLAWLEFDPVLRVVFGIGVAQLAAAALADRLGQAGIATGLAAAGVLLAAAGTADVLDGNGAATLLEVLGVWAVAGAASWRLGAPSVAMAGVGAALPPLAFAAIDWRGAPLAPWVATCAPLLVVQAVALRVRPSSAGAEPLVIVPTLGLSLAIHWVSLGPASRDDLLVRAVLQSLLAMATLGGATAVRSRGLLAAAVLGFLLSEGWFLAWIGDPLVAAGILGTEGLAGVAAVLAFVAWRAGRARRPLDGRPEDGPPPED